MSVFVALLVRSSRFTRHGLRQSGSYFRLHSHIHMPFGLSLSLGNSKRWLHLTLDNGKLDRHRRIFQFQQHGPSPSTICACSACGRLMVIGASPSPPLLFATFKNKNAGHLHWTGSYDGLVACGHTGHDHDRAFSQAAYAACGYIGRWAIGTGKLQPTT